MCEREAGPSVLGIWDVYRSAQEGVVMRETAFYTTTTANMSDRGGSFDPGGGVGHDGQGAHMARVHYYSSLVGVETVGVSLSV